MDDQYIYDSLPKAKKELKSANNKIKLLNKEVNMIKMKNDILNVMVEKPSVETYNCSKCKIYKVKIKKFK